MTNASDPGGRQDRPVEGIDNGYATGYRVRFDEAGADGRIRTSALLRYASDIAWRHSEDLGFDRTWYTQRGRWWVVRAMDLELLVPVTMGWTLRLATAVISHRKIWARRRGEFRLPDGTLAATAVTDWVIVDERGRILRIPPDFGDAFPNPELDGEITRVTVPDVAASAASIEVRVRPQDLDPMGHVNNAVYLDWIEESIEAAGGGGAIAALPRRVAIEYAASAGPGDSVTATAWNTGAVWWVRLTRVEDGAALLRATVTPLAAPPTS